MNSNAGSVARVGTFSGALAMMALVGIGASRCAAENPDIQEDVAEVEQAAMAPQSFTYAASNTTSATQNFHSQQVDLIAGQKITIGTCAGDATIPGALNGYPPSYTQINDTYLRLMDALGGQVGANDDASCGYNGWGSKLSVTAPATGRYTIRAGCYSNKECAATLVYTINGAAPPPSCGSCPAGEECVNGACVCPGDSYRCANGACCDGVCGGTPNRCCPSGFQWCGNNSCCPDGECCGSVCC